MRQSLVTPILLPSYQNRENWVPNHFSFSRYFYCRRLTDGADRRFCALSPRLLNIPDAE